MIIHAKQVLTPTGWQHNQFIHIEDGRIVFVVAASEGTQADHQVDTLLPGFIDVQVNGGGGVLFNQHCEPAALEKMMAAHRRFGTTAMMPTLITDSVEVMHEAAQAIAAARAQGVSGIVGVHFEGPWLSTARKGVHSEQYIRPPTDEELAILLRHDLGVVMVTLAPETAPVGVIKQLSDAGVKVFLGHSNATAGQVSAALEAGAVGFTHLYNAMSPMQSRAPGMVGTALANDASYAGLIVDGYHVDPQCCNVAIRAKGTDRMMLVTDAMAIAATTLTEVPFFDTRILREGDKLTTPDGTLAGSCLTMMDAVRNTVQLCGVSLADAATMASKTPAQMLGLAGDMGSIEPGQMADLVAVNEQLSIAALWQHGLPISLTQEQ